MFHFKSTTKGYPKHEQLYICEDEVAERQTNLQKGSVSTKKKYVKFFVNFWQELTNLCVNATTALSIFSQSNFFFPFYEYYIN